MKRSMLYLISMGLALLLAYTPAFAETTTTTDTVAATSVGTISFSEALSLSQEVNPGWTLISLSLEDENGNTVYHAELLNPADSTVYEITLDSMTGQVQNMIASDEADQMESGSGQDDGNVEYADITGDTGETEQDDRNGQYEQNDQNEQVGQYEQGDQNEQDDQYEQDDQNENNNENESENEATGDVADAALYAKATITLAQAQDIALTFNPSATVTSISLEDENGSPIYEIDLLNGNGQQITVKLDAVTGTILSTGDMAAEQ